MKTLSAIILTALLTACGSSETSTEPATNVAVQAPAVVEVVTQPVKTEPLRFCTTEITTDCEIRYCPQGADKAGNCYTVAPKPEPLPMPILNVVCEENPTRGCPPNGTPKKEPMPVEEWDCIVGCDTSTGM